MINLATNVTFANINRWQCLAPPDKNNQVTLRFWAPANTQPSPPWIDVSIVLSDEAGKSGGVKINPAPSSWNDKIMTFGPLPGGLGGGVGVANALARAQDAYRTAANHNAGLRAIEGVAMTDGWIDAALLGT